MSEDTIKRYCTIVINTFASNEEYMPTYRFELLLHSFAYRFIYTQDDTPLMKYDSETHDYIETGVLNTLVSLCNAAYKDDKVDTNAYNISRDYVENNINNALDPWMSILTEEKYKDYANTWYQKALDKLFFKDPIECSQYIHDFILTIDVKDPQNAVCIRNIAKLQEVFTNFMKWYKEHIDAHVHYMIIIPTINTQVMTMKNTAVKECHTELIKYCDDDDISCPLCDLDQYVERLYNAQTVNNDDGMAYYSCSTLNVGLYNYIYSVRLFNYYAASHNTLIAGPEDSIFTHFLDDDNDFPWVERFEKMPVTIYFFMVNSTRYQPETIPLSFLYTILSSQFVPFIRTGYSRNKHSCNADCAKCLRVLINNCDKVLTENYTYVPDEITRCAGLISGIFNEMCEENVTTEAWERHCADACHIVDTACQKLKTFNGSHADAFSSCMTSLTKLLENMHQDEWNHDFALLNYYSMSNSTIGQPFKFDFVDVKHYFLKLCNDVFGEFKYMQHVLTLLILLKFFDRDDLNLYEKHEYLCMLYELELPQLLYVIHGKGSEDEYDIFKYRQIYADMFIHITKNDLKKPFILHVDDEYKVFVAGFLSDTEIYKAYLHPCTCVKYTCIPDDGKPFVQYTFAGFIVFRAAIVWSETLQDIAIVFMPKAGEDDIYEEKYKTYALGTFTKENEPELYEHAAKGYSKSDLNTYAYIFTVERWNKMIENEPIDKMYGGCDCKKMFKIIAIVVISLIVIVAVIIGAIVLFSDNVTAENYNTEH